MGSLYKQKRSRFWWIKYHQNGRVVRESTGTTKDRKARRMLRVREGDVERGIPIDPKVGRITFEDAAQDVLNDYRTNKRRSLDNVERRIEKHLIPFFRGRRLASLRTSDVRAFIAHRQRIGVVVGEGEKQKRVRAVTNGELNRELAVLKRMFSLAIKDGKLHLRPHIPMLREDNVRRGFFEPEQFTAVRDHLPPDLRPVVTFAYLTGWRIQSEVLPLEWRQVDLKRGTVRLDPGSTKNDKGRVLPYGDALPELATLLTEQRAATRKLEQAHAAIIPYVFHRAGDPIKDFRHAWLTACKAAGCPGRIPHDFRRTAVRNLTRAGVPERIAMAITGHKTRSVFDRYDIVNEADLRDGLRKLNAALSGILLGIPGRSAESRSNTQSL